MDEDSGEKWQTVAKPKKLSKTSTAPGSMMEGTSKAAFNNRPKPTGLGFDSLKPEKKKVDHQIPKNANPLPEAIIEKSRPKEEKSRQQNNNKDSEDDSPPEKPKPANSNKTAQKSGPTVEERRKVEKEALKKALNKIDYSSLETEVMNAKKEYAGNDRWIRLLVSKLNEQLSSVPVDYSLFYSEKGFEWGYPLSIAPKSLTNLLDKALTGSPPAFLEAFTNWCIKDACSTYLSQRKTIHGSQVIIQYIMKANPPFASEKTLEERKDEIKSFNSRRDEMLTILWSYGQAGLSDFARGFQVWYKLMFPLMNGRGYTGFCLAYLQALLQNHKKIDLTKVNKQDVFLNIFDAFFGVNSKDFSRPARTTAHSLYDQLRSHLFLKDLQTNASSYFAQFLMRLGLDQPEGYNEAACENLVECLKSDPECFGLWLKKHPSGIKESQILLAYLAKKEGKDVRKLVHSTKFAALLDQMEIKSSKNKNGNASDLSEIKRAVEGMRNRIHREDGKTRRTRFGWLIFLIIALVGGEIAYSGVKNSQSIRAYNISKPYVIRAWKTCKPLMMTTWTTYIKPGGFWLWLQMVHIVKLVMQTSIVLWNSLLTHLPQVYTVMGHVATYLEQFWAQFVVYLGLGLRKIDKLLLDYPNLSISNLTQSASSLTELIWKPLSGIWAAILPYYHSLENYIQELISITVAAYRANDKSA